MDSILVEKLFEEKTLKTSDWIDWIPEITSKTVFFRGNLYGIMG